MSASKALDWGQPSFTSRPGNLCASAIAVLATSTCVAHTCWTFIFDDCVIDELDLGAATANRVSFTNTQVDTLDLTRSVLTNVDLRSLEVRHLTGVEHLKGATINSHQLAELAPFLANHLGIVLNE